MKKVVSILIINLFLIGAGVSHANDSLGKKMSLNHKKGMCVLNTFGFSFKCEKDWQAEDIYGDTVLISVPHKPGFSFTISQFSTELSYLSEMNKNFFESKGLYSDNFEKEEDLVDGVKVLKVKAFSKENPETRYLAYFYIIDGKMTSILFSVHPKEAWDEYKFLIQDITKSMKIFKRK